MQIYKSAYSWKAKIKRNQKIKTRKNPPITKLACFSLTTSGHGTDLQDD